MLVRVQNHKTYEMVATAGEALEFLYAIIVVIYRVFLIMKQENIHIRQWCVGSNILLISRDAHMASSNSSGIWRRWIFSSVQKKDANDVDKGNIFVCRHVWIMYRFILFYLETEFYYAAVACLAPSMQTRMALNPGDPSDSANTSFQSTVVFKWRNVKGGSSLIQC